MNRYPLGLLPLVAMACFGCSGGDDAGSQPEIRTAFTRIVPQGSLPLEHFYDMTASNGRVLLIEGDPGTERRDIVTAVDVSDPNAPSRAGSFRTTLYGDARYEFTSLLMSGPTTAYVAAAKTAMTVKEEEPKLIKLDLSAFPNVTEASHASLGSRGREMALAGEVLAVVEERRGLGLYSMASQELLGTFSRTDTTYTSVAADGKLAFVGDAIGVLSAIDIDNPSSPHETASVTDGSWVEVVAKDGRAYVPGGLGASTCLRVYDPSLSIIGTIPRSGSNQHCAVVDVAFAEDTVVLADEEFGLRLVDASDSNAITEVSSTPVEGGVWRVVVDGTSVYAITFRSPRSLIVFRLE